MTIQSKVLLYETNGGGHRETVLRYVTEILSKAGVGYYVQRCLSSQGMTLAELERLAVREGCSIVHVLTADGSPHRWLAEMILKPLWRPRVRFIATYYLYTGLYTIGKGLCWDYLSIRCFEKVLISDSCLSLRRIPRWRRSYVGFLPDPWDPKDFKIYPKAEAAERLGLERHGRTRFLLFGDLSFRKGLDLIIGAAKAIATEECLELMLVGKLDTAVYSTEEYFELQKMVRAGSAVLRDSYVPETDVSIYFSAADYVMCCYPRWFCVSSGTFTRACAAGRPVIAAEHGSVGSMVANLGLGLTYKTEDARSLRDAMIRACWAKRTGKGHYNERNASRIAEERTLDSYAKALISVYGV